VSGTPIQRGLEDIYGLMLFLGVSPYENRQWWDRGINPETKKQYLSLIPFHSSSRAILLWSSGASSASRSGIAEVDVAQHQGQR